MKRFIDYHLNEWKNYQFRKPLIIFGARQVGKTYSVRNLGSSYSDFVEINLEKQQDLFEIFQGDLSPKKIINELSKKINRFISPSNKTLLFIDEIQAMPKAITALRYFYEEMNELHVIAAGSLLEFSIQEVGLPVGRVTPVFMYPMSFLEFLSAIGENLVIEEIINHDIKESMSGFLHEKFLKLVGEYLAIGGMPEAVRRWALTRNLRESFVVHQEIVNIYRRDFNKYSKKHQIKYVEAIFNDAPRHLGKKFQYSEIGGDYKKRELSPALDLLRIAGIIYKVVKSSAQGIPIGAQMHPDDFKLIFLDIALSQIILGLELDSCINPLEQFVNKGELVESFVGQEILAYSDPTIDAKLYYWRREEKGSVAEVDYLIQQNESVIPIEVKSGKGTTLKSIQTFLETHPNSPFGIRFSSNNYSEYQKIKSFPLYAICKAIQKDKRAIKILL